MKKLIALLFFVGIMAFGAGYVAYAQESTPAQTETVDTAAPKTFHESMKERFIEGVVWMAPILLTMIFGLAIAMERIIYLTLSGTNTVKLLNGVEKALSKGGVEEAKNLCRDTRGALPAFSIRVCSDTTPASKKLKKPLFLMALSSPAGWNQGLAGFRSSSLWLLCSGSWEQ